jgi:hypothetical protein
MLVTTLASQFAMPSNIQSNMVTTSLGVRFL